MKATPLKPADALRALGALAQDTRLGIFRLLVEAGPTGLAAGEIATALKSPAATVSFHLKELAHAGLVLARQDGRFIFYSAHYDQMNRLIAFLTDSCCARDNVACAPCRPAPKSKEHQ